MDLPHIPPAKEDDSSAPRLRTRPRRSLGLPDLLLGEEENLVVLVVRV